MTDIREPRLAPVSPPYDEDIARLLSKLMPPDAQVDPLVLFRVLAVHHDLADRLRPMASGLLNKGLLPARDREVFISRTTARAGAEYEWGVHASFFGSAVGLDEPTLQALATRPADDPIFDRRTRLLVTAADELVDRARLSAATWLQLTEIYEPAQLLELIILCGWYRTLSTVITTVGLPFEPWAARIAREASPEQRLAELGVELPEPLPVVGSYRLTKRHGDTVYVAGHLSATPDRTGVITGKVGDSLSLEQAREAARVCALYALASLRADLGSLDRVTSILKVFGMVNVAPGFGALAKVLDGCTDLLTEIFGDEAGTPARVAVGMAELPLGAAVEVEMVVAVSD